MIMSIHIWTCCNWSPRASFGLYRCMYGHLGGCPQGMPKVIDHVQYLIFFEVHKPWNRLCCLWMRFWYMVILHTKCMAHVALILHAYWCAWDACSSCQTHNAMLFALLWHGWLMFWICFMHLVLYMDITTKQQKRNLISIFFYHFWSCVNRTKAAQNICFSQPISAFLDVLYRKTQPNFDSFYHFWSCVHRTKAAQNICFSQPISAFLDVLYRPIALIYLSNPRRAKWAMCVKTRAHTNVSANNISSVEITCAWSGWLININLCNNHHAAGAAGIHQFRSPPHIEFFLRS